MAITLTWNYGLLIDVKSVRIEESTAFAGPFTEVETVLFPAITYVHATGTNSTYYRCIIIFEDDTESEPTLPKKVMAPASCRIYGYVLHISGKPLEKETIRFSVYPHTLPQANDTLGFITDTLILEVKTGADGYFECDLLQNAVVNVECIRLGLNYKSRVVPAIDAKEFSQWIMETQ